MPPRKSKKVIEEDMDGCGVKNYYKQIPKEILDFAVYGNNSLEGQTLQVKTDLQSQGASGYIVLNQQIKMMMGMIIVMIVMLLIIMMTNMKIMVMIIMMMMILLLLSLLIVLLCCFVALTY